MDSTTMAVDMDDMYRRQRYIYDVTRRYYLLGRDEMIAALEPPPGGTVVEVACGTARNLLTAARLYPDATFHGFDISHEMLKTARKAVAASPYRDSIRLSHGDATNFDTRQLFNLAAPDRIFISYALSMIPAWDRVVERAIETLAPRGELHIVDFGRMSAMPSLARHAILAWLRHFAVTPRQSLADVVHAIASRRDLKVTFRESRLGYTAHVIVGGELL